MDFPSKLDYQYKLLFLGDTSVGKTSLLIRYTDNIFDSESLPTLGVDVRYKYVTLENQKIRLDIWDTAGQERFKNITKNYLNGANGIFFVCDITNGNTLEILKTWINDAKANVSPETEMVIVGNKIDLNDKREIKLDSIKKLGEKYQLEVFETSAKTGEGVEDIFIYITQKLFQNKEIGKVLPGDDEATKRRGSYILKKESIKGNNNTKNNENNCSC